MSQVEELTGSFYVLGYPYSAPWDGRFHEIKVDVTRKGCRVNAQSGFFNPKPFREFTKLEKELHLFDLALNERSELSAPEKFPMAALVYDAGEGARLRVLSMIPGGILERFAGKNTEIVALFFDAGSNVLSLQRTTMDPRKYRDAGLTFTAGITPPPGAVNARLIMRDLETGQSAIASANAFVPGPIEAPGPRLTLGTPLLLAAGGSPAQLDGAVTGQFDLLSWHDVYPYDAVRLVPVLGEVTSGPQVKITAAIPLALTGSSNPNVYFSANLAHVESGRGHPVAVSPIDHLRQNQLDICFLELGLDAVPPGSYVLNIHAGDKTTGVLANARVPVTIR